MIYWRFKIDGTTVEEPYGWDGATFTLERSKVYHGLDNLYTDEFTFVETGAGLIQDEFDTNGVGGSLDFLIEKSCDNITFETVFEGIINLMSFEKLNNEITVQIENSSFDRVFKNRIDMPVDLLQGVSVDGVTINTIDPVTVRLHSKEIQFKTNWELPELLPDSTPWGCTDIGGEDPNAIFSWEFFIPSGNPAAQFALSINPALAKISEEHEKTFDIFGFNPDYRGPEVSDFPISVGDFFYKNTSTLESTILLNLRLKFKSKLDANCNDSGVVEDDQTYIYYSIINEDGSQASETNVYFRDAVNTPFPGAEPYTFDVDVTDGRTLTIQPGQVVYLIISRYGQFVSGVTGDNRDIIVEYGFWFDEPNCTLQLVENDKTIPSDCKGFYVYEAFSKISSLITGQNDCFRSDYFSRALPVMQPVDLEPETDGKGWNSLITRGTLIRKMEQSNNTDYPFTMSFKDLFDAMDCRYNLGMRIETVDDVKYIRVEPKYFFYSTSPSPVSYEFVTDIKESVNVDSIFSLFNSGYQKWEMNIAKANGIDEFNSPRTWRNINKNAKNTLDRVCKFVTSGYLIEFTRREQFRAVPTTNFETDNDNFFIAVNRQSVTSTKYSDDGTSDTYDKGEVSEIGYADSYTVYATVVNILNAETSYNLRHSPFEMAMCWADYLGITQTVWNLASSKGNIQLKKWYQEVPSQIEYPSPGYPTFGFFEYNDINSSLRNRLLFSQLNSEFEIPITFEEYNDLITNSEKRIAYFCGSSDGDGFEGYISSIKYRPNVDGIASFKLNKY